MEGNPAEKYPVRDVSLSRDEFAGRALEGLLAAGGAPMTPQGLGGVITEARSKGGWLARTNVPDGRTGRPFTFAGLLAAEANLLADAMMEEKEMRAAAQPAAAQPPPSRPAAAQPAAEQEA